MADVTSTVTETAILHQFQQSEHYDKKTFTPVDDGIETVGTHNLITIPANAAFVSGYVVFKTSVTSGGAATLTFQIGGDSITGALPIANMTAGDVKPFAAASTTATFAGFSTSSQTLDVVVGTAALTAGSFTVVVKYEENA